MGVLPTGRVEEPISKAMCAYDFHVSTMLLLNCYYNDSPLLKHILFPNIVGITWQFLLNIYNIYII